MILNELVNFSNQYGKRDDLVLAGGGNTSAKKGKALYIKGSGTALATITVEGFVEMDRSLLAEIFVKNYPEEDAAREAAALADLMAARMPGEEAKRPSVETTLHSLFPQTFVLHLHPALVNGLTCGKAGEEIAKALFGDEFIWIESCRPGYILAKLCSVKMNEYTLRTGKPVSTVILQNHGIFIAADTTAELDEILENVLSALDKRLIKRPDFSMKEYDEEKAVRIGRKIKELYGGNTDVLFESSAEARRFARSEQAALPLLSPFTPDHIVYCKAFPLFLDDAVNLERKLLKYKQNYGYAPKIIIAEGLGIFAAGQNKKDAKTAQLLFNDAMKVAVYSESFGGPLHLSPELTEFIINWEVESYRQKQN